MKVGISCRFSYGERRGRRGILLLRLLGRFATVVSCQLDHSRPATLRVCREFVDLFRDSMNSIFERQWSDYFQDAGRVHVMVRAKPRDAFFRTVAPETPR